jgi:putative endonuclease
MRHQNYFVYILTNANRHTALYIGVTNSLERRASEHSLGLGSAFARQYNADKLIYFEAYPDPRTVIAREKQLKRWSREKKEALIPRRNPEWHDLFEQMYALHPCNGPQ